MFVAVCSSALRHWVEIILDGKVIGVSFFKSLLQNALVELDLLWRKNVHVVLVVFAFGHCGLQLQIFLLEKPFVLPIHR